MNIILEGIVGSKAYGLDTALKVVPYYNKDGFDTYIVNNDKNLYAIFDGMGTSPQARRASETARDFFEKNEGSRYNFEILRMLLDAANLEVIQTWGGTTAVITAIDNWGCLNWVAVGDSRLYVLKDNRIKQMTSDEGVENIVYNHVGSTEMKVTQLGQLQPTKWDKFMICSDGITGDRDPDLMSDETVEKCLRLGSAKAAADGLLKASSKKDDKSIIVVFRQDIIFPGAVA